MNYVLVKEEEVSSQGYSHQYSERLPDGRVILPMSAIKVLSNCSVELISKVRLQKLIAEQKAEAARVAAEEAAKAAAEEIARIAAENQEAVQETEGSQDGADVTVSEPSSVSSENEEEV